MLRAGYYHDIYHEENAAHPLRLTRAFVEAAFSTAGGPAPLLDADQRGHTFEEYRALSQPLRPLSPKWLSYRFFRLFLRTLGRWSDGIRVGRQSGFNSGRTLDYVYRNRPGGFTALGRLIDRQYLAGTGWRGIRVRRQLLERTLLHAIGETHARKQSVHLLDVAAGAGRYLLETLTRCESLNVSAELRDFEGKNLDEAKVIADALGLDRVRFVPSDAFGPPGDRLPEPATGHRSRLRFSNCLRTTRWSCSSLRSAWPAPARGRPADLLRFSPGTRSSSSSRGACRIGTVSPG